MFIYIHLCILLNEPINKTLKRDGETDRDDGAARERQSPALCGRAFATICLCTQTLGWEASGLSALLLGLTSSLMFIRPVQAHGLSWDLRLWRPLIHSFIHFSVGITRA